MEFVTLGKTKLLVSRTAFGAESLDCKEISLFGDYADEKACALVREAYDAGINFFDSSHSIPLAEKRLGVALHGIRHNVVLATKSAAQTVQELRIELQESLANLETDSVDLFQLENPLFVPTEKSPDGLYNELVRLKKSGTVRHIGLATESLDIAKEAIENGIYEVVQFPFNMVSSTNVQVLVQKSAENNVGCIAAQPLCGGLVNNIPLALGFLHQFENVVPVWGVHTQEELQQILYFTAHPPVIDEAFLQEVEKMRNFFN